MRKVVSHAFLKDFNLLLDPLKTLWKSVKNFLWGLFLETFYRELRSEHQRYTRALSLILFGDLMGLPILRTSLSLRLLPYVIPHLQEWRESAQKEDDVLNYTPEPH